jgi:hypothetical protein
MCDSYCSDTIENGAAPPIINGGGGSGGGGVSQLWINTGNGNIATGYRVSVGTINPPPSGYQLYTPGDAFFRNLTSNIVSPTSSGLTYLTGNLVVSGNVFSSASSVGGSVYYTLGVGYTPSSYTGAIYGTTYNVKLSGFTLNGSSTYFNVSPSGFLRFSQVGIYQITGVFLTNSNNINGIAIGSNSVDGVPNSSQTYLYRYTVSTLQNPTTPLTIQFYVGSTSSYYYIDLFGTGAFTLQPTTSGSGGTWLTVTPYVAGTAVTNGNPRYLQTGFISTRARIIVRQYRTTFPHLLYRLHFGQVQIILRFLV